MSSSTEAEVLRGEDASAAHVVRNPELRTGSWTRFGLGAVLGDEVTEQTLSGLAESARAAARSQGYAVGWAQGRREAAAAALDEAQQADQERNRAEDDRRAQHTSALTALRTAVQGLAQAVARVDADRDEEALVLARELTTILVGHELRLAPDPGDDVVRRVLAARGDDARVTVRLAPGVVSADGLAELIRSGARIVEDPLLDRDDAVVESEGHVVDLRIQPALDRVRKALS